MQVISLSLMALVFQAFIHEISAPITRALISFSWRLHDVSKHFQLPLILKYVYFMNK